MLLCRSVVNNNKYKSHESRWLPPLLHINKPLTIVAAQDCMLFYHLSYHNILNVLLHQVVLGGNQHWSAKCIQICIM